ncbi:conserved hypothetical protein [Culex quinquefasciatus]|uniref:Serine/threonine-protein phosphatase 4 regulatory subunit 3-like central domain-containing protein n=1 Tax=Culex quinquefasciatus TaxID=7176 RepID=B0WQ30_CULQU|nr:conserved hypothetical protein [Culex quinquefasciatus]|eukprot:XP_001850814.1 conserved hypothetical protein [Culex quinquefasciatus]
MLSDSIRKAVRDVRFVAGRWRPGSRSALTFVAGVVVCWKRSLSLSAVMLLNIFKDKPANEDYHTVHLLGLVLERLSFCIEHHNYHIKICIINKDLLRQILVLMKSTHTFLVLGAIRFLRYKRRHNLLEVAQTFKTIKNKNDHQQERLKEMEKGVGVDLHLFTVTHTPDTPIRNCIRWPPRRLWKGSVRV